MALAQLRGITLDCSDPDVLGRFYQQLTGMNVLFSSDDYVALGDGGTAIGCQRVENYQAPEWPGQRLPQQLHLDFMVEDLDAVLGLVTSLGATQAEHQPGGERYRVFLDPAGHPFCLLAP